jgi:ABC-2 type transport system ATP-binding protein
LAHLPGVRSAEPASDADGEGWWLFPRGERAILPEIAELVRARGWPVSALRAERGRLDDVFRAITMPSAPGEALRDAA